MTPESHNAVLEQRFPSFKLFCAGRQKKRRGLRKNTLVPGAGTQHLKVKQHQGQPSQACSATVSWASWFLFLCFCFHCSPKPREVLTIPQVPQLGPNSAVMFTGYSTNVPVLPSNMYTLPRCPGECAVMPGENREAGPGDPRANVNSFTENEHRMYSLRTVLGQS